MNIKITVKLYAARMRLSRVLIRKFLLARRNICSNHPALNFSKSKQKGTLALAWQHLAEFLFIIIIVI